MPSSRSSSKRDSSATSKSGTGDVVDEDTGTPLIRPELPGTTTTGAGADANANANAAGAADGDATSNVADKVLVDYSSTIGAREIATGYARFKHTVHDGALQMPAEAYKIMDVMETYVKKSVDPNIKASSQYTLPGLDSVQRPSLDPSVKRLKVTELSIEKVQVSKPAPPPPPPTNPLAALYQQSQSHSHQPREILVTVLKTSSKAKVVERRPIVAVAAASGVGATAAAEPVRIRGGMGGDEEGEDVAEEQQKQQQNEDGSNANDAGYDAGAGAANENSVDTATVEAAGAEGGDATPTATAGAASTTTESAAATTSESKEREKEPAAAASGEDASANTNAGVSDTSAATATTATAPTPAPAPAAADESTDKKNDEAATPMEIDDDSSPPKNEDANKDTETQKEKEKETEAATESGTAAESTMTGTTNNASVDAAATTPQPATEAAEEAKAEEEGSPSATAVAASNPTAAPAGEDSAATGTTVEAAEEAKAEEEGSPSATAVAASNPTAAPVGEDSAATGTTVATGENSSSVAAVAAAPAPAKEEDASPPKPEGSQNPSSNDMDVDEAKAETKGAAVEGQGQETKPGTTTVIGSHAPVPGPAAAVAPAAEPASTTTTTTLASQPKASPTTPGGPVDQLVPNTAAKPGETLPPIGVPTHAAAAYQKEQQQQQQQPFGSAPALKPGAPAAAVASQPTVSSSATGRPGELVPKQPVGVVYQGSTTQPATAPTRQAALVGTVQSPAVAQAPMPSSVPTASGVGQSTVSAQAGPYRPIPDIKRPDQLNSTYGQSAGVHTTGTTTNAPGSLPRTAPGIAPYQPMASSHGAFARPGAAPTTTPHAMVSGPSSTVRAAPGTTNLATPTQGFAAGALLSPGVQTSNTPGSSRPLSSAVASATHTGAATAATPNATANAAVKVEPKKLETPPAQVLPTKLGPQWEAMKPEKKDDSLTPPKELPPRPDWYEKDGIADLERSALPEWFNTSAPHRTPKTYVETREKIIKMSDTLVNRNVTNAMVRRVVIGDAGSLHRLRTFLVNWGIINQDAMNESTPTPAILRASQKRKASSSSKPSKKRFDESLQGDLIQAVVQQSKRRKLESDEAAATASSSNFIPIDWEEIAETVGHGASPEDCQRNFMMAPLKQAAETAQKSGKIQAERPITPDASTETDASKKAEGEAASTAAQSKKEIEQEFVQGLVDNADPKVLQKVLNAAMEATGGNVAAAQSAAVLGLQLPQFIAKARNYEIDVAAKLSRLVDLRMQKLENRMTMLDDVEGILEAEKMALELERRDLYTARCRHWFGGT